MAAFYNHPEKGMQLPGRVLYRKYLNKISGPLLDRIDLHVEVNTRFLLMNFLPQKIQKASAVIRGRVIQAREIQAERYKDMTLACMPMRR